MADIGTSVTTLVYATATATADAKAVHYPQAPNQPPEPGVGFSPVGPDGGMRG